MRRGGGRSRYPDLSMKLAQIQHVKKSDILVTGEVAQARAEEFIRRQQLMEEQELSDGEDEEDRSVSMVKGETASRGADGKSMRSMRSAEAQPVFLLEKTAQDWRLSNFSSEELAKARNVLTREVDLLLDQQRGQAEVRERARSVRSARSTSHAYQKALNSLTLNM